MNCRCHFKMLMLASFLSLFLFNIATNALSATKTFNPTGDTYIAYDAPDTNFCNELEVAIAANTDILAYVKFDISSIPSGSIINSANLRLFCTTILENGTVNISRYSSSYNECEVDWNNYPILEGPTVSSTPPGTSQWWEIPVTSIVKEGFEDNASSIWFGLEKLSDGLVMFYSSESSTKR